MDGKVNIISMPKGFDDFKHFLVVTCAIIDFILAILMTKIVMQNEVEALFLKLHAFFGPAKSLIIDKDSAFYGRGYAVYTKSVKL